MGGSSSAIHAEERKSSDGDVERRTRESNIESTTIDLSAEDQVIRIIYYYFLLLLTNFKVKIYYSRFLEIHSTESRLLGNDKCAKSHSNWRNGKRLFLF